MEKRCQTEVVGTHGFLEDWIAGRIEQTEEVFARFSEVISDSFIIVYPDGQVKEREVLIKDVWDSYGKGGPDFVIEIRNFNCRLDSDRTCVVMYEEWFIVPAPKGRLSTGVFKMSAEGTHLEWVLVHETWLPEL